MKCMLSMIYIILNNFKIVWLLYTKKAGHCRRLEETCEKIPLYNFVVVTKFLSRG